MEEQQQQYNSALYQAAAQKAAADAQADLDERESYRPLTAQERAANWKEAKARHKRDSALANIRAGRAVTAAQAQALASYIADYEGRIKALQAQARDLELELDVKRDFMDRWVNEFNSIWRALEEIGGFEFYEKTNGHGYRVKRGKEVLREQEGFETIKDVLKAALTWWKEFDGIPF